MTKVATTSATAAEKPVQPGRRFSTDAEQQYLCPGETEPISRSIHYARLRAFHPACARCKHNCETGQLPKNVVRKLGAHHSAVTSGEKSLLTSQGIRGLNQNEITRTNIANFASAFARLLCRDVPLIGRFAGEELPLRRRPVVILGRDHRPGSPALTAAAIQSLLRTGCDIVDIGEATHPIMQFTVDHLHAAGGIFITGCGYGPQFAGIDFFAKHGHQIESQQSACGDDSALVPLTLESILTESNHAAARPSRSAGTIRSFRARVPYVAELLRHFRRAGEVRFCVAAKRRIVREHFIQLLDRKTSGGKFLNLSLREESEGSKNTRSQIGDFIQQQKCAFAVQISEDGRQADVFDENGRWLPPDVVFRSLIQSTARLYPGSAVVVESSAFESMRDAFPDQACYESAADGPSMSHAMTQFSARIGGGTSGRYRIDSPHCDAIALVGLLLEHLAETQAPLSRLVAESVAA